jgi:hypothetical protein
MYKDWKSGDINKKKGYKNFKILLIGMKKVFAAKSSKKTLLIHLFFNYELYLFSLDTMFFYIPML